MTQEDSTNRYTEFIQVAALFVGLVAFAWLLSKRQGQLILLIAVILLVGLVYLNAPPPNHDSWKQRMELSAVSLYEQIKPSLCSNPEVTRKVISLVPKTVPGLYGRASVEEPPPFQLTARDLAILHAVARYRFLSST